MQQPTMPNTRPRDAFLLGYIPSVCGIYFNSVLILVRLMQEYQQDPKSATKKSESNSVMQQRIREKEAAVRAQQSEMVAQLTAVQSLLQHAVGVPAKEIPMAPRNPNEYSAWLVAVANCVKTYVMSFSDEDQLAMIEAMMAASNNSSSSSNSNNNNNNSYSNNNTTTQSIPQQISPAALRTRTNTSSYVVGYHLGEALQVLNLLSLVHLFLDADCNNEFLLAQSAALRANLSGQIATALARFVQVCRQINEKNKQNPIISEDVLKSLARVMDVLKAILANTQWGSPASTAATTTSNSSNSSSSGPVFNHLQFSVSVQALTKQIADQVNEIQKSLGATE